VWPGNRPSSRDITQEADMKANDVFKLGMQRFHRGCESWLGGLSAFGRYYLSIYEY
jgi:hypothetical protein